MTESINTNTRTPIFDSIDHLTYSGFSPNEWELYEENIIYHGGYVDGLDLISMDILSSFEHEVVGLKEGYIGDLLPVDQEALLLSFPTPT